MTFNLQTISSSKIDTAKWNNCVQKHKAPIYCNSMYLNAMADNWVGLVWNNYEAIFPICYRKKIFFKYSYTPAFIQQLGFIGNIDTDCKKLNAQVRRLVGFGDIMLNHQNKFANKLPIQEKTNFIIPLQNNYETIANNYNNDLKQNLKKANREAYTYTADNCIEEAIDLYKKYYANRMQKVTETDFDNFKKLCLQLEQNGNCFSRKIVDNTNETLAIALLLKDENRIYNIANSTTSLGKKTAANQLLIDRILNEFADSNLIFDFEGSDLIGVKSFYQKYGAINQPYFHWCLSPFVNRIIAMLK